MSDFDVPYKLIVILWFVNPLITDVALYIHINVSVSTFRRMQCVSYRISGINTVRTSS